MGRVRLATFVMALTVLAGCNRSREPACSTPEVPTAIPVASPGKLAVAPPNGLPPALCARENDEVQLTAAEGGVMIGCWSEVVDLAPPRTLKKPHLCLALTASGAPKPVAEPVTVTDTQPAVEVRGEGALASVCMGTRCKKLGKRVVAALDQEVRGELSATADLGALVTGLPLSLLRVDAVDISGVADGERFAPKAWLVAGDRRLQLKPPVEYTKPGAFAELEFIRVMGNLLVVTWMNNSCSGSDPCQVSTVVDATGANKWTLFTQGQLIQLDDERVVAIPYPLNGVMTEHHSSTGKQLGALKLLEPSEELDDWLTGARPRAAKIDANTLVASWYSSHKHGWDIVWIAMPVGKPPTISARRTIEGCR